MSLPASLLYGLANLLHPRMLWLMVWPMLVSLVVWISAAIALWARLAAWLAGLFGQWLGPAAAAIDIDANALWTIGANVVLALLFVPLVYFTALFILGIFAMPAMVDFVAGRAFPELERRRGGGTAGSLWNAAVALAGMAGLFVASVPLWFIPPLWPLIPLAIFGWVNQRLLRYDALAEHADQPEMGRIFRERRFALYALGVLLALLAYVPFIGFLGPVVFGLAYIHYLLGALAQMRSGHGSF